MHQVIEEPCASGWCLKQTEGQNTEVRALFTTFYVKMAQVSECFKCFKIKLFQTTIQVEMATDRSCLVRKPSDSKERCAEVESFYFSRLR